MKIKNSISDKSNLWILLLGPILSLVTFIVTYYIDPLNYSEKSSLAAIPAFLLSVIVLIISHIVAIFKEVERVSSKSDELHEAVKNYLHVIKIGTPKKAWKYIIHRLPIIDYVQNTSFNFADENEQSIERLYDDENYRESIKEIARHIAIGLTWKDIGDTTAIDRFQEIRSHVLEYNTCKGNYTYKFIRQSEPQIGFVLLTYKDGTSEVLFNWDFRDIPQDPFVLLSRDREIFNMFAAQFKGLWRVAVLDYDSIAIKSTSKK